jgi:hypothetical protein
MREFKLHFRVLTYTVPSTLDAIRQEPLNALKDRRGRPDNASPRMYMVRFEAP